MWGKSKINWLSTGVLGIIFYRPMFVYYIGSTWTDTILGSIVLKW